MNSLRWLKLPKNPLPKLSCWLQTKQLQLLSNKFHNLRLKPKLSLPPTTYQFLDNYMLKFLNSKTHSGVTPGQQLMLVCGPPGIGKTQLILKNLSKFVERKKAVEVRRVDKKELTQGDARMDVYVNEEEAMRVPDSQQMLAVVLDLQEDCQLSYYGFLNLVEERVVKAVLRKVREMEIRKETIIDCELLLQILKENNSEDFILMYFKDYLNGLVNDLEEDVVSEATKERLTEVIEGLLTISNAQKDLGKIYKQTIDILVKQGLWKSELQTGLRICLNITKKIEYQYRPPEYTTGYYRDGLLSTSYLLDILNFFCGLHPICKRQVQNFYQNPLYKPSPNHILKGNHIDCALILTNLPKLLCYRDPQFLKWLDHLTLRTYNPSQLKTHIPVILELGNSQDAVEILRLGRLGFANPTVLEVPGYKYEQLGKSNLMGVLTEKQAKFLYGYLGFHVGGWVEGIKAIVAGVSEKEIKRGEWGYCHSKAVRMRAQINKVFVHEKTRRYHDDHFVWRVTQQLEILAKRKGNILTQDFPTVTDIVEDPISQVLQQQGLTYNRYYEDVYHLSYQTDIWQLQKILKQFKSKNSSLFSKLKYWHWKTFTHYITTQNTKYDPKFQAKVIKKTNIQTKRHMQSPISQYHFPQGYQKEINKLNEERRYLITYVFAAVAIFVLVYHPLLKGWYWKELLSDGFAS